MLRAVEHDAEVLGLLSILALHSKGAWHHEQKLGHGCSWDEIGGVGVKLRPCLAKDLEISCRDKIALGVMQCGEVLQNDSDNKVKENE